jgi:hypothetical protein
MQSAVVNIKSTAVTPRGAQKRKVNLQMNAARCAPTSADEQPVDFSLPTRVRARCPRVDVASCSSGVSSRHSDDGTDSTDLSKVSPNSRTSESKYSIVPNTLYRYTVSRALSCLVFASDKH